MIFLACSKHAGDAMASDDVMFLDVTLPDSVILLDGSLPDSVIK